jgi:hypothetical protein
VQCQTQGKLCAKDTLYDPSLANLVDNDDTRYDNFEITSEGFSQASAVNASLPLTL